MYKERLLEQLTNRTAHIGIVGLGYVGLPLAVAFAEVGFTVTGLDVSAEKVAALNGGHSYIPDIPTSQLAPLVQSGKLHATTSYEDLRGVDAVSVCVPTPLRKTKDPDMSYVISAADALALVAHPGMLIVLESTTYPGTTDEILIPRLAQNKLTAGEKIFFAFFPERGEPRNKKKKTPHNPQKNGGRTPDCPEGNCPYFGA